MTEIHLILRDGSDQREPIDLDRLTPSARALAETIATRQGPPVRCPVILESGDTVRKLFPERDHIWFGADELDQPHTVMWQHWSAYPQASTMDPHDYLEQQAMRLPIGYHPIGAHHATRVPSADSAAGEDRWLTRRQVLELLRGMGRPIAVSTWSAYVARGQAPAPGRYIGRTPQWDREAVETFAGSPT